MTIQQVLDRKSIIDKDTFPDTLKIAWLSELDAQLFIEVVQTHENPDNIKFTPYTADDFGKQLLVPFPYAAEDHQTKNAMALVNKGAALIVRDSEASEKLIPTFENLLKNDVKCAEMSANMHQFALPGAIDAIVENILSL